MSRAATATLAGGLPIDPEYDYKGVVCLVKVLTALSDGSEWRIRSLLDAVGLSYASTGPRLRALASLGLVELVVHADLGVQAWKITEKGRKALKTWSQFYTLTSSQRKKEE